MDERPGRGRPGKGLRRHQRRWERRVELAARPGDEARVGEGLDVGACLRSLRAKHGYSLRGLAEQSGLAVNTLSLIENRKVSPSVSTLQQLAVALDEPITAFFETLDEKRAVVRTGVGVRPRVRFAHGELEELGAGFTDPGLVPLLIHLDPQAGSEIPPVMHTGLEFVYCLGGQLEYWIVDQSYLLGRGDSLIFEAHQAHCWRNPGEEPAQALLVLCPSAARDHAADRHLLSEALASEIGPADRPSAASSHG